MKNILLICLLVFSFACTPENKRVKHFKKYFETALKEVNYPIYVNENSILENIDVIGDSVICSYSVDDNILLEMSDIDFEVMKLTLMKNMLRSFKYQENKDEALYMLKNTKYVFKYIYKSKASDGIVRVAEIPVIEVYNYIISAGDNVVAYIAENEIKLSYKAENESLPEKCDNGITMTSIMVIDNFIVVRHLYDGDESNLETEKVLKDIYISGIVDSYNLMSIDTSVKININYEYKFYCDKTNTLLRQVKISASDVYNKRNIIQ